MYVIKRVFTPTKIRRPLEAKLVHEFFTTVLGSQAQGPANRKRD
jgi:hypothetical protein